MIEIMSPFLKQDRADQLSKPLHSILTILPTLRCITPSQVLASIDQPPTDDTCPMQFDTKILNSDLIQRPCQYLKAAASPNQNLATLRYNPNEHLNSQSCLNLLLKHLEHADPTWSEIIHFTSFLNTQLIDSENSIFCDPELTGDLLPGFKSFVVRFMIQMSHDFALPSLDISDGSALKMNLKTHQAEFKIDQLKIRRKWENDPHPYLFFNPDGQTFTFFGFYIHRENGALLEPNTNRQLFDNLVISKELMAGIERQDPNLLRENIGSMSKKEKIFKMLKVMGVEWMNNDINSVRDPDPSYELTMDNLLKMLAIYMRLRANIPVISKILWMIETEN